MPVAFLGFDHIDVRVPSLAAVEAFYDRLMPELGLTVKTVAHVDAAGIWRAPSEALPYNAAEYHEAVAMGQTARFIGFIEDAGMRPTRTRVAIRVSSKTDVLTWEKRLRELGASDVELDEEIEAYPAVFFADPAGTLLELCARRPKT